MLSGIALKTVAGFFAAATAGLGSPITTAIAGDSQVKISWALPPQQIFGVEVDESVDSGNTWIIAAKHLPPTSTQVNIQQLTNGKNYLFRVRWIWLDNTLGIPSLPLAEIPIGTPSTPTGLIATPSADQVGLSWDKDPNKSIVGYEIDQSVDSGNTWSIVKANTGSPSSGYLVSNLLAGKTYTFRIRAIGFGKVQSEYSDSAVAKVATTPTGGYALNYTITNSKVTLTWDTPADLSDVQQYDVNVSSDGGVNWYKVATLQGGTNTAIVPYVIGGSTYQVIATSAEGQTSDSQVQLVENNVIPDSTQTFNPSPSPSSLVAASNTPTPNSTSDSSSHNSGSSNFILIIGAAAFIVIGGGIWALVSSNKKKNTKSRYKAKPRKPYKKKVTKKKKLGR